MEPWKGQGPPHTLSQQSSESQHKKRACHSWSMRNIQLQYTLYVRGIRFNRDRLGFSAYMYTVDSDYFWTEKKFKNGKHSKSFVFHFTITKWDTVIRTSVSFNVISPLKKWRYREMRFSDTKINTNDLDPVPHWIWIQYTIQKQV